VRRQERVSEELEHPASLTTFKELACVIHLME
jgi:hypothetical protein